MFLRKVEITGFKSFFEKTVFEFRKPFTALLGPNGCGKSNFVDALLWVLGYSHSNLRVTKTSDLLYRQGSFLSAFAEVSLELEINSSDESAEKDDSSSRLSLKKRYYRHGETQYFINDKKYTLKDFKDFLRQENLLLSPYGIIPQGKVDLLLLGEGSQLIYQAIQDSAGLREWELRLEEAQLRFDKVRIQKDRLRFLFDEARESYESLTRSLESVQKFRQTKSRIASLEEKLKLARLYTLQEMMESQQKTSAWDENWQDFSQMRERTSLEAQVILLSSRRLDFEKQLQEILASEEHLAEELSVLHQEWQNAEERRDQRAQELQEWAQKILLLEEQTHISEQSYQTFVENFAQKRQEENRLAEEFEHFMELSIQTIENLTQNPMVRFLREKEGKSLREDVQRLSLDSLEVIFEILIRDLAPLGSEVKERYENLKKHLRVSRQSLEKTQDSLESSRLRLDSLRQSLGQAQIQEAQIQARWEADAYAYDMHTRQRDELMKNQEHLQQTRQGLETQKNDVDKQEHLVSSQLLRYNDQSRSESVPQTKENWQKLIKAQIEFREIFATLPDEKEWERTKENPPKEADIREWEASLKKEHQTLQQLGPLWENDALLEEQKESYRRCEDFKKQLEDIEESYQELRKLREHIERKMKKIFQEKLDELNKLFEFYLGKMLSGSGRIEYKDRFYFYCDLNGEKSVALHSLSGGQQALVVIAFLFALAHLHPAPFYILDEIDSNLDEYNSRVFADFVLSLLKEPSQFILVTHNKVVAQRALALLGITRGSHGESLVFSLNLGEDMMSASEG